MTPFSIVNVAFIYKFFRLIKRFRSLFRIKITENVKICKVIKTNDSAFSAELLEKTSKIRVWH